MKMSEIRELSTNEIEEKIQEEKVLLTRHKLNYAVSALDNPGVIKQTRRLIARLKTELRQRQLSEQNK